MRIGVCIPCHGPNVKYLKNCLKSLELQTVPPTHIAISISGISYTPVFSENVFVTISPHSATAATNRNRAAELIADKVELISFFDADDLMHPRRLEMIRDAFIDRDLDIFLHSTQVCENLLRQNIAHLSWEDVRGIVYKEKFITGRDSVCGRVWFDALGVLGDTKHPRQLGTCGHVTCKSSVWNNIRVPEATSPYGGEDSEYIYQMYTAGYKLGFTQDILSRYVQTRDNIVAPPIPLSYSIPEEYIVSAVPEKVRDFSEVVPGTRSNYVFGPGEYDAYLQQYRESRFAYTKKKGGWDCLRHYEILASGCIPIVEHLSDIPSDTMTSYPKEILTEAYSVLLPWHGSQEQLALYTVYVERLLKHCRDNCTTYSSALQFVTLVPTYRPKVLMINCHPGENYSREFLSIGLRRLLGSNFIDYPKNDVLYRGCDTSTKHGNGFGYAGLLEDIEIDRTSIPERILAGEFDCIIYGKVGADETALGSYPHLPHIEIVRQIYTKDRIFFLYGGDGCQSMKVPTYYTHHLTRHMELATCVVRELER